MTGPPPPDPLRAAAVRFPGLPVDTCALLLLTATAYAVLPEPRTEPGVDAALLRRASAEAGLDPDALEPAERAGLVRTQPGRVHCAPQARQTAYADAPATARRAAHLLLARAARHGAPEPPHPGRIPHLLHRAYAAPGPDEQLAEALAAAAQAPGPGAHDERALALTRAAALTDHRDTRALHLCAAADHARRAGRPEQAAELLTSVRELTTSDAVRGRAELVHGLLALRTGPVADARESLLLAADLLTPHDPDHAARARLAAADASWSLGDPEGYRSALAAPTSGTTADPRDAYETGMAAVLGDLGRDFASGLTALRRVVDLSAGERDPERLLRAGAAALVLGDLPVACRLGSRALAVARAHGSVTVLPRALEQLAYGELRAGRHARARAHAEEGLRTAEETGQRNVVAHQQAVLALVASLDSDADAVARLAGAATRIASRHGLAQAETLAQWALARADLARGRVLEAAARLGPLVRPGPRRGHFAVRMLAVPCYVEAAVLSGERGAAVPAADDFAVWASLGHDPQSPAQLARCRALLAADDPEAADAYYAEALALHARCGGDFEQARTALVHGKWLRRTRRPGLARGSLRDALVAFERCGATAWAAQTAAELRATGETATAQLSGELGALTPQQLRIARHVAEGATNREVARRLSVSPRTVDHHLRNIFATLGVRSRVELSRVVNGAQVRGEGPAGATYGR
ncbi:LuxR C-terminal-related transcriptional regulator [Streptomyces sp. Da 82-17]|uniref:LuxR C-terminal-related transcriptional regulator n=1 Tax=Streptomyces sp. Da 82-17 TaxID=3377116 RepID=UPI0038D4C108